MKTTVKLVNVTLNFSLRVSVSESLIGVPGNRYDSSGRCTVHPEAPYRRHVPEGTTVISKLSIVGIKPLKP